MTNPSDDPIARQTPPSRVSRGRWRVLTMVAAIPLAVAGCSTGGEATSTTDAAPSDTTAASTTSTTAAPRVYDFEAVSQLLGDFVAERGLAGAGLIVVEQEDGVVHEEYWGGFGASEPSLATLAAKASLIAKGSSLPALV